MYSPESSFDLPLQRVTLLTLLYVTLVYAIKLYIFLVTHRTEYHPPDDPPLPVSGPGN